MTNCYQLSERVKVCPGDPVRVAGKHGLWRFIRPYGEQHAELVGPYSPTGKTERSQELSRVFPLDKLRSAGRADPRLVQTSEAARLLSHNAHAQTKRRRQNG